MLSSVRLLPQRRFSGRNNSLVTAPRGQGTVDHQRGHDNG
jgi:hypothetical protein